MGPEGSLGLPGAPGPKVSVWVNLLVTPIHDCHANLMLTVPGFCSSFFGVLNIGEQLYHFPWVTFYNSSVSREVNIAQ